MLGDTTHRALLLQSAEYFEAHMPDVDEAAPPTPRPPPSSAAAQLRPLSGTLPSPPSLRLPSLAYFFNEHMVPARPAVLTGVLAGWPASSRWADLGYLKRAAGHRTVPVEVGAHYLDAAFEERLLTLREYIEAHLETPPPPAGAPRAYLAQHQLFEQLPRLRRDIVTPDYCVLSLDDGDDEEEEGEDGGGGDDRGGGGGRAAADALPGEARRASDGGGRRAEAAADGGVRVNAWLGPAGTLSPMHYDRYHNLLCQVAGFKYFRLYGLDQTPKIYATTQRANNTNSFGTSPVRVEAPIPPEHAMAADATYVEGVLAPGDMLFLPKSMWHYVRSLTTSVSVNFWY